ncbi:glutathione S-transferase family protein [Azospirillum canadense]|uniref:glutathione S-transferase family protein n=1 Tax=Azospirillum canadense TaxID=403962 RepID=UPI00222773C9|nr:glutathione S-transferase family protein [Azospirillum canadense]MCW2239715.1 glutathione S-transferase [Azospirillum canadense]
MLPLHLVSHHLCPYVQRAAIVLAEKGMPCERTNIDLANKPAWFTAISPLGKVPLLKVGGEVLFESVAICEYLEEAIPGRRLHPVDPILRAKHRGWIEFGSAILNDIAGFYAAPDARTFAAKRQALHDKFAWVERSLGNGPWFAGTDFSLVDAVFGPVFRYFDTFEMIANFGVFEGMPKVLDWRAALAARPSVREAVAPDYPERLRAFLIARNAHLSSRMA